MAQRGVTAIQANAVQFAANVLPIIRELQAAGAASANAVAAGLNARKVATARGGKWSHVHVAAVNVLRRKSLKRLVFSNIGGLEEKRAISC